MERTSTIGYVSTYPPRECGIATFTRDLARAMLLRGHVKRNLIIAVDDDSSQNSASRPIIRQHERRSYVSAAGLLNESGVEVVSLQHEFGIFGGKWGAYILDLCRNIEAPLVTTFHTVLSQPPDEALEMVRKIANLSTSIVVTVDSAAATLAREYGIEPEKITVIPHGASVPDQLRRGYARRHFQLQNRRVLVTSGLINPSKGIEYAIEALPSLVSMWPDILYVVAGETHPEVRKQAGEAYRGRLIGLTRQLRMEHNVRFIDKYMSEDDLSLLVQAADVYVAPYLGRDQVSSGTITLALTHGKPVVSTPTVFAEETLSENRGLICEFADSKSLAHCVARIFSEPGLKRKLTLNAFKYGQELGWVKVADEYADVFRSAVKPKRTFTETLPISEV